MGQAITDYPAGGQAQIAETTYGGRRLIVRRTRLLGPQAELWPDWRHFCFITNRDEDIALVEAEHREHAVVEQVIADLKDQALAHFPSGDFHPNGAWTVLAALAHNLLRWTQLLGLPDTTVRSARTLRRRLLSIPGRLTRHARGWTLHLPARWPWHGDYISALNTIRAPPPPPDSARQPPTTSQQTSARPGQEPLRASAKTRSRGAPARRNDPSIAGQAPQRPPPRRHTQLHLAEPLSVDPG